MAEEDDVFYVVRKGDVIGIYRSLWDCQRQAGSSVCDPSTSVFRGHGLPKAAEEYLASHGLKNAEYTISASDVEADLFGKLVPCPPQKPAFSVVEPGAMDSLPRKSQEVFSSHSSCLVDLAHFQGVQPQSIIESTSSRLVDLARFQGVDPFGSEAISPTRQPGSMIGSSSSAMSQNTPFKFDNPIQTQARSSSCQSCVLEFDGASKGNPGQSGAGAVLRAEDGSAIYRLREGVGIATNNVAEYRALILGLKFALENGFKHIRVTGDSKLVCMQIQDLWKTKNQNMADLCQVAKRLKDQFMSFRIDHVLREYNSVADVEANRAINLRDGQVQVDRSGT